MENEESECLENKSSSNVIGKVHKLGHDKSWEKMFPKNLI